MRRFRYLLVFSLGLLFYGFLLFKAHQGIPPYSIVRYSAQKARHADTTVDRSGTNRGNAASDNSWRKYANDSGGYHLGWGSGHWISSLNKMLVWGGNSHNYKGNNSVRVFDPVTNTWEFLWPNDWTQGVQNRDNHVSFYVPSRGAKGEFWVLGGSHTPTLGAALTWPPPPGSMSLIPLPNLGMA